ncbi:MAG: hypothetical protein NVSMB6_18050 [Burkholderiaceae bacterium]
MRVTISLRWAVLGTLAALVLAGCGGGSNNDAGASAATGQPDSFFSAVSSVIASTSDTAEPTSTDAITATALDGAEPIMLM